MCSYKYEVSGELIAVDIKEFAVSEQPDAVCIMYSCNKICKLYTNAFYTFYMGASVLSRNAFTDWHALRYIRHVNFSNRRV